MNQILVTEKLYVTPELKRKKNFYRIEFFLSVFFVCLLFSFYIYAEYDRTKSEEVGKQILSDVSFFMADNSDNNDDTTIKIEEDVIMIVLESEQPEETTIPTPAPAPEPQRPAQTEPQNVKYSEGEPYYTVATVKIPKINVNYAVLSRTSDALLKISPTKFWGPEPNEVGNFCIVGHNYHDTRFFSQVPSLEFGDTVELTDTATGRTLTYSLYDKYEVVPSDVSCTSQLTNGKKEVTLITCTRDSKRRVIAKFREM